MEKREKKRERQQDRDQEKERKGQRERLDRDSLKGYLVFTKSGDSRTTVWSQSETGFDPQRTMAERGALDQPKPAGADFIPSEARLLSSMNMI